MATSISTTAERSRIMRAVKGRDTAPEILVRRLTFAMGYRFRLHRSDLPGKPDLAFIGRRKVIFVHGCFWHGHNCARGARVPKHNAAYWIAKISRNRARDQSNLAKLAVLGWKSMVIWECELSSLATVRRRIVRFLGAGRTKTT